ncbi:hypothetical protein E2C01_059551 [Portunus trituberculatus]|uniref:Uncharacterized protein n=1 Tax=Portunus trituberculatus TaxID=210409 RepID=A0A5B7H830_PORTR|nr:hypothetical protein [Portunus trituberculatus]
MWVAVSRNFHGCRKSQVDGQAQIGYDWLRDQPVSVSPTHLGVISSSSQLVNLQSSPREDRQLKQERHVAVAAFRSYLVTATLLLLSSTYSYIASTL